MAHKTVTQRALDSMPRSTGLMRRKGIYYLNVRVPTDLRPLYGKTKIIRRSLETSVLNDAKRELDYQRSKLRAEFDEKRKSLLLPKAEREKRYEISDREAHDLVFRFFIEQEKASVKWWEQKGRKLDDDDRQEVLDTLRFDEAMLCGGVKNSRGEQLYVNFNEDSELDRFLEEVGMECPKGSAAYDKLSDLFHRAEIENIQRSMDRVTSRGEQVHQPLFQNVFAHTAPPKSPSITLGELLKQFEQTIEKRAESTKKTYRTPARLLLEVFGASKRLDEIGKTEAQRLMDLLKRAPVNATKLYQGKSLEQAIEAADAEGNSSRLSAKSLENYFININGIFNFAVDQEYMEKNPFKNKYLRQSFEGDAEEKEKVLFSSDQLKRLFDAPLYTGCNDDENGYAKAGSNRPRRGRFWIPLLALFHGLRLNEAAQLYTEDVGVEAGIPYLDIRATRADGSKCDKRLKTSQSKRRIPLHPEVLKIGFLDFVAGRQSDKSHPRLFPEIQSYNGYFSDHVSRWFGGFRDRTLGQGCKATFHSFRHHFRSSLGEAGVPLNDVEALGGWESRNRTSERRYDRATLQRLLSHIEKVKYQGLDLSHLYSQKREEEQ